MQSSRSRLVLAALFGALALGAFTAAAAQAVEAPRWSIEGTILEAGKTHFITAKLYSTNITLKTANVTVSCTVLTLTEGVILGSSAGNAGKNNEVVELSSCKVSGKAGGKTIEKCKVVEPAVTVPLRSELVENENAEPENKKGSLLILLEAASGTSLITLKFTTETGGNCPVETKVSGKVAAEVRTDPENGTLGELVELGQTPKEAHSWLLLFPATPVAGVTRISGGKVEKVTGLGLKAFSEEATLEGGVLILLAKRNSSTGKLETELRNWSPLP